MSVIGDLVPLLYRARWIQFSLSGEVTSRRERVRSDAYHELKGSLLAAPGGRYRADLVDEDGDRDLVISDGQPGRIPFPELLNPSWLLADFDLEVTGETEHIGRPAYTVVASPRLPGRGRAGRQADRVSALVDAQLGVLLRYEKISQGRGAETAEFTSLHVDAAESADPLAFTRPAGTRPKQGTLGPVPEGAPQTLGDDQVNLLYRTMLGPQNFSAELRERADKKTMAELAETALSSTALGSRTQWLWRPTEDSPLDNIDLTSRLAVAMPGSYRIEAITDPGPTPACISCDGHHLWLVYSDRVVVRSAAPPPAGIALILDPAWLLSGYQLSADGTTTVSARRGLQVVAVPAGGAPSELYKSPLSGTMVAADKIEATIDVRLGIALRLAWYFNGNLVLSAELSNVTQDTDPAAFRVEPPPGTRVVTGGPLAEAGTSPAEVAWTAAKGASRLAVEIGRRWVNRPRP